MKEKGNEEMLKVKKEGKRREGGAHPGRQKGQER